MKARDVMTDAVVSVRPDTPTSQVARLLLDNGISAVPVVDSDGAPVGMVSEGDLIGRDEAARVARRDWWLALLAEGEQLSARFSGKPARSGADGARHHVGAGRHGGRGNGGRRDRPPPRRPPHQARAGRPRWPYNWHCQPRRPVARLGRAAVSGQRNETPLEEPLRIVVAVGRGGHIHRDNDPKRFFQRRLISLAAHGSAAKARNRSARLTMPIIRPSRTTGTRLMRWAARRRAISSTSVSSPTVTTGADMMSRAVRSGSRRFARKSALSCSPSARRANHQSRRATRAASSRPIRSPSLTIPTGAPSLSTTGTALIPLSSSNRATWDVGVSGRTDTTASVMTSRAFIRSRPFTWPLHHADRDYCSATARQSDGQAPT